MRVPKRVVLEFVPHERGGEQCVATFEGDWTGWDVEVAMRSLRRGYKAYQAERRRAGVGATTQSAEGATEKWESVTSGESDLTSSASQAETTQGATEQLTLMLTSSRSRRKS